MLKLVLPATEQYDEVKNEFLSTREKTIQLEHSLISLSKWESKWCKPFLSREDKTYEESVDYIRCMTITNNVSYSDYLTISGKQIKQVGEYIEAPMTATVLPKRANPLNREIVTAELIYYWMIALNIPFECQKWHLNRLLTLINVCNIKNTPKKKMGRNEILSRNKALNDARRKTLNTRG